jgi:hypothetical protein
MDALFGTDRSPTVEVAIAAPLILTVIVGVIDAVRRAADGLVLEHLDSGRQA